LEGDSLAPAAALCDQWLPSGIPLNQLPLAQTFCDSSSSQTYVKVSEYSSTGACPFAISAENDILMASARALTAPRNVTAAGDVAGSVEAFSQQVDRLQTFNSNM